MVLRGFMVDFIHLFAPHYSARLIREAAALPNQEEVDELLSDLDLPVRSGGFEEPAATT